MFGPLMMPVAGPFGEIFMKLDKGLVYRAPFVAAGIAPVQLRLPGALFSRGHLYVGRSALRADSMVNVHFQSINNVAGL